MKILANGCSYVFGTGLDENKKDPNNFINVLFENRSGVFIDNLAFSGKSNLEIFESTIETIQNQHYDEVYVGWTSYPRHHFYLGFDCHDYPGHRFSPSAQHTDNFKHLSIKELTSANKVLTSCHDHYQISSILRYSKILKKMHDKIYFINVLCNWSNGFFIKKKYREPRDLDLYTQQILDVENRTDEQILDLYNKQHQDYLSIIKDDSFWDNWLNLYCPAKNFKIDIGNDNSHPGPLSYRAFGQFLQSKLL